MLPQLIEDQNQFTPRLERVKDALERNQKELQDLRVSVSFLLRINLKLENLRCLTLNEYHAVWLKSAQ